METKTSAVPETVAPLELLVRNKQNNLFKSAEIAPDNRIIAICINNRGWLLVKIPADKCLPETFLQTVRDITGLPVVFPSEKDYQDLQENLLCVKLTIDVLRKNNIRVTEFQKSELEQQKNYVNQRAVRSLCDIRLAIDLDELF